MGNKEGYRMKRIRRALTRMALAGGAMILALQPFSARLDAMEENPIDESTCAFTKQLQDPNSRMEFSARLNAAKEAAASPYGERARYSATYSDDTGEPMEIDSFSLDCLGCHDGINARIHNIRYKNNVMERTGSMETVRGSHPIGMHYGSYAYTSNQLRGLTELNEDMVLVDGKVGCLSCHNPLNPNKKHLASKNLCLGCHIK